MDNQDTANPLADIIDAIRGAIHEALKEPTIPTSSETLNYLRDNREREKEDKDTDADKDDEEKDAHHSSGGKQDGEHKASEKPKAYPKQKPGKKDPKLREKIIKRLRKFHVPRVMRRGLRVTSVKGHVFKLSPGQTVYVMPLTQANFVKTHFLLETHKPFHLIRISSQAARSIIGSSVLEANMGKQKTAKKPGQGSASGRPSGSKTGGKHGNPSSAKRPHKAGLQKRQGQRVHPKKPAAPAKRKTISVRKPRNPNKPKTAKKAVNKSSKGRRIHANEIPLFYPNVGDYVRCLDNGSGIPVTGCVRHVNDGKSAIHFRHNVVIVDNTQVPVVGAANDSPRIWFVRKLNELQ